MAVSLIGGRMHSKPPTFDKRITIYGWLEHAFFQLAVEATSLQNLQTFRMIAQIDEQPIMIAVKISTVSFVPNIRHMWPYPILVILFRCFDILAPKDIKVIWHSNLLIMTVPDEEYSRNASCILYSIIMLLFYPCNCSIHAFYHHEINILYLKSKIIHW